MLSFFPFISLSFYYRRFFAVKKSSSLLGSFLILALLFSNVFAQATAQSKTKTSTDTKAAKTTKVVTSEVIEQDMAEALTVIQDNYVDGKKLDYNVVFKSSIEGMLHTLDPHSSYFDAKEFEEFKTEQSSQYYGIGATIGDLRDAKDNVIATFIKATFANSPANRAGLRYGDKIVDVNGVSMLGKPFSEVRQSLRGPRGTLAKIIVERYGTGKRETVEIIRDAVSQPSVSEAYMIRPGVGYIAMTGNFTQTTFREFREAMTELKEAGMQQLVIDLRNNGGGLVMQVLNVANIFLTRDQTIITQKGRVDGANETYKANNPTPDDTPIVVLVNRNSASASEILAGSLQDHDRALIVGENTFGKGLITLPFPLEYGSMLLLTIAKYETPSGRLIQRDYSNGDLYSYYTNGGSFREENPIQTPKGAERKTDSGRTVYGGGGINPDVVVKPQTITNERARLEQKLNNPVLAFTLDLAFGKIAGFESYRIDRPIKFEYVVKSLDYPVTENLYQTFKKFALDKYKIPAAQIDKEREFIERTLRAELVTAAYGATTSFQVFNEYDVQLLRAIEVLPQAKQLALEGAKANAKKTSSGLDR
jgi:carboxyl-terminal processing protease